MPAAAAGLAVSWHLTWPSPAGLVWGLTAAVCAALGVLVVAYGVWHGWWADIHLSRHSQRPLPLACATVAAAVVWLACREFGAPRELLAAAVMAPAGGAAVLVCTCFGKVSLHTSAASGSVTLVALLVDPWCAALFPLVAAVAWARLRTGAHTPGQAVAGALLGTGLTLGVVPPLL
ncbi:MULTISPECIES: phosphatase PAP2 family protein [Streptomyces]|uniref:Phosphatase PAP2 family protein n=1 Tax=Streptomyces lycii TaxID=2654337 RepID=A0ABQ7FIQ6_9ACTN|nr:MULTISPECIES: phosphatase PAP2 family protein [Streptomyces]KAF4408498.1 phosphatase PAP2 family protein [Streptomyces lycii]